MCASVDFSIAITEYYYSYVNVIVDAEVFQVSQLESKLNQKQDLPKGSC